MNTLVAQMKIEEAHQKQKEHFLFEENKAFSNKSPFELIKEVLETKKDNPKVITNNIKKFENYFEVGNFAHELNSFIESEIIDGLKAIFINSREDEEKMMKPDIEFWNNLSNEELDERKETFKKNISQLVGAKNFTMITKGRYR